MSAKPPRLNLRRRFPPDAPSMDRARNSRHPGRRPRAQVSLVAMSTIFNLWVLRAETLPAQNLNDSAVHLQMVRWALMKIHQGRIPFDGWYPLLGLGSAHFHHYQSLPHILTAYIALFFGPERAFHWTLYLLLCLWPVCVYASARLLGWGPWVSALSAVVAPLLVSSPGHGYEYGSYVWLGYGVWSQLWAMWLLPLSWGLSWRAVSRGVLIAPAALVTALTIASHYMTAYLALLAIGIWVLVKPSEMLRRLGRAALVGAGALLAASWVIVPLLIDSKYVIRSVFAQNTFFYDSFGAKKILGWLFTGRLYDDGRLPVVTLLVGIGGAVCLTRFRDDERARVLLGAWTLSLLLFFGRPTLGPVLKLLPGSGDLFLHRYVMGVHLAGIFLAGVGTVWVGELLIWLGRRIIPDIGPAELAAGLAIVALVVLLPAWRERAGYAQGAEPLIRYQLSQDATDGRDLSALIDEAKRLGGGRIYAGTRANWGQEYLVASVPVYAYLLNRDADAIGYRNRTGSMSADVEGYFDESNPAHYNLFNVRYLILPARRRPPVQATMIDHRGLHTLWTVPTSGYFQIIDTRGAITADRTNLATRVRPFLASSLLSKGIHPLLAFAGAPPASPTASPDSNLVGPPGRVEFQSDHLAYGSFSARVTANRPAVVMLKSSYDPRWKVLVDGSERPKQIIAPSFVGTRISPGVHSVVFRYEPFDNYPFLFTVGGLALLALAIEPPLVRRRLARAQANDDKLPTNAPSID
jgi:hypothetical protein